MLLRRMHHWSDEGRRALVAANKRRTVHGCANTKLAKVFDGMKARCHDIKCAGYRFYGARGITVCEEWLSDRNTFFAWATANGTAKDSKSTGSTRPRGTRQTTAAS